MKFIDIGMRKGIVEQYSFGFATDSNLSIKGTVSEVGIPLFCRVRLFDKRSGRILADIQTEKNGSYAFKQLLKINFFIIAHHPEKTFNAVIQDNVVPK